MLDNPTYPSNPTSPSRTRLNSQRKLKYGNTVRTIPEHRRSILQQSVSGRTRNCIRLLLNLLVVLSILPAVVVPAPMIPLSPGANSTRAIAHAATLSSPDTLNPDLFLSKSVVTNQFYCSDPWCDATRANDGADSTYWRIRYVDTNTYWRVDVGSVTSLNQIKILQDDTYYATSVDVYGGIYPDDTERMLLLNDVSVGQGWNTINLPNPKQFRYIWIQMQAWHDAGFPPDVHIHTIQGFGDRPFSPPPSDVFRNALSDGSCSGAWCHNPPQFANDGYDGTYWRTDFTNNYWTVYLGTRIPVSKIRIYQAPLFEEYATSFTIKGSNSPGGGNGNCPHNTYTVIADDVPGVRGWNDIALSGSAYLCYWINAKTYSGSGTWQVPTIQGYTTVMPTDDEVRSYNPSFNWSSNNTVAIPLITAGYSNNCPGTCDTLVSPITGNFHTDYTDLSLPGRGPAIGFVRSYNSRAAITQPPPPNEVQPLGYGWTDNYNMYIEQVGTEYLVHQEDGSVARFNSSDFSHASWIQADLIRNADQTYVMTRTHGITIYTFNTLGRLTSITDRNGNSTTLSYDGQNYLQTVTDPASRQLSFTYTVTGTVKYLTGISSISPGITRSVSFGYDSGSNLQTVTDVGGQHTGFTYDTSHQLKTITDPMGGLLSNTYEAVTPATGRLIAQKDPMSRSLGLSYSAPPGTGTLTTQITNPLGQVTSQDYSDYRLSRVTSFPGTNGQAITDFSYKPGTAWWEAVNDPNSNSTQYIPDANGNILSASDALGRTTQYAYNLTNDLTTVTYANQLTSTLDYDTHGNVVKASRPYTETGQVISTTFTYDTAAGRGGDLLTITNPLGQPSNVRYDAYGFPNQSWDALGHTSVYTYNSVGWLLSSSDPMSRATSTTYTLYGAPYVVTDSRNYTTTYAYDANQNLKTATDANYRTVTYGYNADNELIRVTQPDTTYSTYDYDGLGRIKSQSNPLRQSTSYSYDDVNRITTVTDPLTHQYQTQYNLVGLPTQVLDPKFQTTSFTYDAAYQLKRVDYSDPNTADVQYNYDALGLRSSMVDGTGTTLYDFDSLNRPVSVQDGNGNTVAYGYDAANRLTQITYPNIGTGTRTVTRGYDNADRLTSVQDWLGNTTQFTLDASGVMTGVTYPAPTGLTAVLGYNNGPQLTSITYKHSGTSFLTFSYTRDSVGVLNTGSEVRGLATSNHSYEYDSLYRLRGDNLASTNTISNTWGYSAATEILGSSQIFNGGVPITTTRAYNPDNQLSTILQKQGASTQKNLAFTFDNNGARIQQADSANSQTINYTYDQENRLTQYSVAGKQPTTTSFTYNGDGLRMSKTYCSVGPCIVSTFTWDSAAGTPLLLSDSSAAYIYGPGGMLIEQVTNTNTPYYYQQDQLGSIRSLTNSSGTVVNTYDYDAYGLPTSTTGTQYNPFGFSGEYKDSETGLIYLRARYYDPSTQQFLTKDALTSVTEQPYAYAGGSPLNAVDPNGQEPILDWAFLGWDASDIGSNGLNWGNGLALAGDIVSLALPVDGVGTGLRLAAHAGDDARFFAHADDLIHVGYHGTSAAGAESILARGILDVGDGQLGRGFYTALDRTGAEYYAATRAVIRGEEGSGVVLGVYMHESAWLSMSGKTVSNRYWWRNFKPKWNKEFDYLESLIDGPPGGMQRKFNVGTFPYLIVR